MRLGPRLDVVLMTDKAVFVLGFDQMAAFLLACGARVLPPKLAALDALEAERLV